MLLSAPSPLSRTRARIAAIVLSLLLLLVSLLVAASRPTGRHQSRSYVASPFTLADTRGVVLYDGANDPSTPAYLSELQSDLPAMRAVGFNTVRMITTWLSFEPTALPTAQYNASAFANLRAVLDTLRANHLRAMVGLNYLGNGWSPGGISSCAYMTDPTQWAAFVSFANYFLGQIAAYSDMTTALVFAETAVPCGLNMVTDAPTIAADIRPTVGDVPQLLDPTVRAGWQIGYMDDGMIYYGWSHGASPLAGGNGYNLQAMGFLDPLQPDFDVAPDSYDTNGCAVSAASACVQDKLGKQTARMKAMNPALPLLLVDTGQTYCDANHNATQQSAQATVEPIIAQTIAQSGYGDVTWGWSPGPPALDCSPSASYGGLAITNQDGTLNAAGLALEALYNTPPLIAQMGVSQAFTPWAVWVTGTNLLPTDVARLSDTTGAAWGGDIAMAYSSSSSSFQLPTGTPPNAPPSNCNAVQTCTIHVTIFDTASGLSSQGAALTLPVHS